VAGEGAGTVGEREAGVAGHADDGGAVVVVVGHDRDPREAGHPVEVGGAGEVGVGDDHPERASRGQPGHAGLDRPVEAALRLPHHQGAEVASPLGHLGVVTDDGRRKWGSRLHDVGGHDPCQLRPVGGIERRRQPQLGLTEGFDRDQHGHRPE
jgi:hypothetical protein